jgi:hypothetical protein
MTSDAFLKPLKLGDTETQTVGCRHNKPGFCGKNGLPKICANVRIDGICMKPPRGWNGQFSKLGGMRAGCGVRNLYEDG